MTTDVFISYSRAGSLNEARALRDALQSRNIPVFLDERSIAPGDPFPEDIANALLNACVIVVLADEYYFTRPWCVYEFEVALAPYRGKGADLSHMVVALAQNEFTNDIINHLPPPLAQKSWPAIANTEALAAIVQEKGQAQTTPLSTRLQGVDDEVIANLRKGGAIPLPGERAGLRGYLQQLPTTLKQRFVGRDGELWQLFHLLETRRAAGGPQSCLVQGGAGMGKTQLVAEYIWRYGQRHYPGGIVWIDADVDRLGLISQLYGVLKYFVPDCGTLESLGKNEEEQYRTIASLIQNAFNKLDSAKRVLWLVDNLPEPVKGAPPQSVEWWCPVIQQVVLLATSRRAGVKGIDNILPLAELQVNAAIDLLSQPQVKREWLSNDEWAQIVRWVGCLPLALVPLHESLSDGYINAKSLLKKAQGIEPALAVDEEVEALREDIAPEYLRGVTESLHISYGNLAASAELLSAAHLVAWLSPVPIPDEPLRELIGLRMPAQMAKRGWLQQAESSDTKQTRSWRMHRVYASFLRTRSTNTDAQLSGIASWLQRIYARGLSEEQSRAMAPHRNVALDNFLWWCSQHGDQASQTYNSTCDLALWMATWQLDNDDLRGQRYVGGQLARAFSVDKQLVALLTAAYAEGDTRVALNIATLLHVLADSEDAAQMYLQMLQDPREEVRWQVLNHATEHKRIDVLALPLLHAIMSESSGRKINMRIDPRQEIWMGAEKLVTVTLGADGFPAVSGTSGVGVVGFEKMLPPQNQVSRAVLPNLVNYMHEGDGGQRGAAINILGRVLGYYGRQYEAGGFHYGNMAGSLIYCALNEEEEEIAIAAAQYLGWMDDDNAGTQFGAIIAHEPDHTKRLRAMEMLGVFISFAEAPLSSKLSQQYEDGITSYQMEWGKGRKPNSQRVQSLLAVVLNENENDDIRKPALEVLLKSRSGKKAIIETFTQFFDGRQDNQVIALADTMQRFGSTMQSLFWWRGQSFQMLGAFENAQGDYQVLLDDKSKEGRLYHALVYKQLGDIEVSKRNFTLAMDYFNTSIELDAGDAQTYLSRARAFEDIGQDNDALADYHAAIKLMPADPYAYLCRGIVYGRLRNSENALKDYDKALSLQPGYSEIYLYRGYEHYNQHNHKAAAQDLTSYLEKNPGTASDYHVLACCLIALELYQDAVEAENKAIALQPDNGEQFYFRAVAYYRLKKNGDAYNDAKQSRELNPGDQRVQQLLDQLSAEINDNVTSV